ncbi:Protein N-methyltransferase nnt1 [Parelaphostrongylus tenuis]|uniref:proton-translocating NAD(P)(+) transhydrogenase n=1 Tax=Parelaphostrongylus tenuis TaxID=148309 RepID=A0AAD5MTG9_PARTN|nr:Protein N-methyltransferase nnt1 [Parelaphostrongylus tenuis]
MFRFIYFRLNTRPTSRLFCSQTNGVPLHRLTLSAVKETFKGEQRVALSPAAVKQLCSKGFNVQIEKGAGTGACWTDEEYASHGAKIVEDKEAFQADIVLKVRPPSVSEVPLLRKEATLISFIYPNANKSIVDELAKKKLNVIAMDCVPRISRAQVPPAKVLVIGGGVAGLSAIGTARGMGAIVRGFDTREAVKEQIQSLGGEFLTVPVREDGEGAGGYAKEMSKEFLEAEMALFARQCRDVDIIISTALIPGKPAPRLFTEDMIRSMRTGSVVVDLAAEAGGNIETTKLGECYTKHGVVHIGYADLPSRLPTQASTLYANNISKLVMYMTDKDAFKINLADEVVRSATVLHHGELLWPPPVIAEPSPTKSVKKDDTSKTALVSTEISPFVRTVRKTSAIAAGLGTLSLFGVLSPNVDFAAMTTTFALAGIAGYHTVWGVVPALHSPLMSVTNAISGTTVAGALCLMGGGMLPSSSSQTLALAAAFISSINIGGGFVITKRMLDMFRRKDDPPEYNYLYAVPAALFLGGYYYGLQVNAPSAHSIAYLGSSLCCVGALAGLSSQKTARVGNALGMTGVAGGLAATLGALNPDPETLVQMGTAMGIGSAIGVGIAQKIQVSDLPQLVAAFHSFVGLAATMTCLANYIAEHSHFVADPTGSLHISYSYLIVSFLVYGIIVLVSYENHSKSEFTPLRAASVRFFVLFRLVAQIFEPIPYDQQ